MEAYKDEGLGKIGGKAYHLRQLELAGVNVPEWFVVPAEMAEDFNEQNGQRVMEFLREKFPEGTGSSEITFSVRSSGVSEDSGKLSYAGQFATFLDVKREDVPEYIRKCLASAGTSGVEVYTAKRAEECADRMGVIVQQMIHPERSGVLFTSNPNGLLNESVIVCGEGVGRNVVEDLVPVTTYYYNRTDKVYYYDRQEGAAELKDGEITRLLELAAQIETIWDKPQDIEWCIRGEEIFVLQARPITTLDDEAVRIVLDNSNIVESYPGTTLPLSISFVKEAYYRIFKNCLARLTSGDRVVEEYDGLLRNMVDSVNGRIYYRISNWYDILAFLPFHKKIIPVWQDMLGVSEKKVTTEGSGRVRTATRWKVLCNTVNLLLTAPKKMDALDVYFAGLTEKFREKYRSDLDERALLALYNEIADSLTSQWDITLVNDMYAFIYTGLLKHELKKKLQNDLQVNRYISNLSNIESMRPIEELVKLAQYVRDEGLAGELECLSDGETGLRYLGGTYTKEEDGTDGPAERACEQTAGAAGQLDSKSGPAAENSAGTIHADLVSRLRSYIDRFGDRNLEELKLESRTFRTSPELLVQRIQEYVADPELDRLLDSRTGSDEAQSRMDISPRTVTQESPEEYASAVKSPLIRFCAKRAAIGIKNREKSRLNRCRIFGMIRQIFLSIGANLCREGKIGTDRDIFYLTFEEVAGTIEGREYPLKDLVLERKEKYVAYGQLPPYSRLIYSGKVVEQYLGGIRVQENTARQDHLQGTPCSEGVAEGEALVIDGPGGNPDVADKILVAKMTDPGWVFLIARAKGIISEKGSLLSHTAIISRELGKPTVVGARDATKLIRSGDRLRVNGGTGEIVILRRAQSSDSGQR